GLVEDPVPDERRREMWWLLGASLVVVAGLVLALLAKTEDFGEQQARLGRGELLDLNTAAGPQDLLPFLRVFPDSAERESMAENVWSYLQSHRPLPNVG